MNVVRYDKVILIKEMEKVKTVGETYEVANITDTSVILRNPITKIAVCSVNIDEFDEYFEKPEEVKGWTKWYRIIGVGEETLGWYRTNQKKVEVKIPFGMNGTIRSMATCSQGDEFNLAFGMRLAYMRCERKYLKRMLDEYSTKVKEAESRLVENKDITNKMLASLFK